MCVAYSSSDTIFIVSIGDSTVFFENNSGQISKFLINDESPGEQTHSLCQSDPLKNVEYYSIQYSPGLLILSTDGVVKSLSSNSEYSKISNYYLNLLNSCADTLIVKDDLKAQLEEFSLNGSGDDCTIALIHLKSDQTSDPATPVSSLKNSKKIDISVKKKKMSLLHVLLILLLATSNLILLFREYKLQMPALNQINLCPFR